MIDAILVENMLAERQHLHGIGVFELHQTHRALLCPIPQAEVLHLGEIEGGTSLDGFGGCFREGLDVRRAGEKTRADFEEKEQEEANGDTGEGETE